MTPLNGSPYYQVPNRYVKLQTSGQSPVNYCTEP